MPLLARWYFDTWGCHVPGRTLADEQQRLEVFLQSDELPLLLVAVENEVPVAAAQLKFHERTERPERQHWLGGVYVAPSHRGTGLAATLIEALVARGTPLGVRDLYLQTEVDDGGLYARLGWQPLESTRHASGVPVRIMHRPLGADAG
ncbi:GNAT family N-acetyltransferase [Stenotrophomonas sp. LGBM10]|uniref:GNAT family N-acetyltransferase n=1 Tax=Stenotrophomonas sp. LGBM10 TaxID=3390038 RepID=UPI00398ACA0D